MLFGKTQAKMTSHDFRYRGTTVDLCNRAPAYSSEVLLRLVEKVNVYFP